MATYTTTGRSVRHPGLPIDGKVWDYWSDPEPQVHRSAVSCLVLRLRRTRWLDIDVPASAASPEPQRWRVSVSRCNGETDTEILKGAHAHVRAELEILETLVQRRRNAPVVPGPARWVYRLPDGTHVPCVYFLRNGTRMKIGTTTQIRNRVSRLTLRPEDVALIVPGDRGTEEMFHKRFASHRVGTTEWFEETGTLRDYIETARTEQRA